MIIGLTGGIGSGKSTISNYLKEKGCTIVDADLIARHVVEPGQKALTQIVDAFGSQMLFPDGTLDRKKLGRLVFAHKDQLDKLNKIMGQRIREEIMRQVENADTEIIVLDAAMLLESGLDQMTDTVWIVDVSDHERIKRVMIRDGVTEEEVKNRMKAQMSRGERLKGDWHVIHNDGAPEESFRQVDELLAKLGYIGS